jgi:Uncharacterized conserved protein (COG2071)
VRLSLSVRRLLVASWPVRREEVARVVYPGLEPDEVDGLHLASLVAIEFGGGRLGPLPVPPFAQLNARTYVRHGGERAVYFLRSYVTPGGFAGVALGAPFRAARISVGRESVRVPAAGVSVPYRVGAGVEAGPLAAHELGLYEAAGLREFRIRRGPAEWRAAEPAGPVRADALLALGFDVSTPPSLVYARDGSFESEVPPRAVPAPRSAASRSRR